MKVTAITPSKNSKTGLYMWRVQFEEDSKSMWLGFAPSFTVGHILDNDKIQVSSTGKSWVFRKKEETPKEAVPPSGEKPQAVKQAYGKHSAKDS